MKKMILLVFVAIVAMACQKNESDPPTPQTPETNYYPLTTGSYWVYQKYNVSGDSSESEVSSRDSIIIIGDTLINQNTYKVFENTIILSSGNNQVSLSFVRDSSGYMVDISGGIIFSSTNFVDTLNQGAKYMIDGDTTSTFLYSYSYKMEDVEEQIAVPAGTFDVLNYQGTIFSNENMPVDNPRYSNTYYADGVGKVMSTNFYFSANDMELHWRLADYYIAPE